jgi:hypothetical protein
MLTTPAELTLFAIVEDLQRRMAAVEADAATRRTPTLDLLRRLLPALAGAFGSDAWCARDAISHPALKPVLRGWNVRKLGIFLADKANGVVVDGLMLERIGTEGHVVLWRVIGVES